MFRCRQVTVRYLGARIMGTIALIAVIVTEYFSGIIEFVEVIVTIIVFMLL